MKQYLVTGKNGHFYWYYMYDGSATAILQPGRVFERIEEAERVFDEALKDSNAEEVTLYEIDEDGNKRIVKREGNKPRWTAKGKSKSKSGKGR